MFGKEGSCINPPVLTQFGNPDPNAAPLNITQLVQLLNTLVSSEIQGSYIPYVLQNSTPGTENQDKAWIVLDSQGRPVAVKVYYNGNWRRVYNGMIGEVRLYHGDPTIDFNTNGLGLVGGEYDGWHLCNGQDGTPDLSDRFMVAGHMNNANGHTGYNDGWQTFIDGTTDQKTGGDKEITLDAATTYAPHIPAVNTQFYTATGNTPQPHTGDLWGKLGTSPPTDWNVLVPEIPGNPTPDPIPVLNPFIAIGFIIFVGYS